MAEIESLRFRVEWWARHNPGASNAELYAAFPGGRKPSLRRSYNRIRSVRREKSLPPEQGHNAPGEFLQYWSEPFFPPGQIKYIRHPHKPEKHPMLRNPLAMDALKALRRDIAKLHLTDEQKFALGVEIVFLDGRTARYSYGSFARFVRGTKGGLDVIDHIRVIDTEIFEP